MLMKKQNSNKAIFLDRDGVINIEVRYLSSPNDLELIIRLENLEKENKY